MDIEQIKEDLRRKAGYDDEHLRLARELDMAIQTSEVLIAERTRCKLDMEAVEAERDRLLAANRVLVALAAKQGALIKEAYTLLDYDVEMHEQAIGCGVEDRNITDRYEAAVYGLEYASDRIYGELINPVMELLKGSDHE